MTGLGGSLRRVARIARWEVTRSAGTVDRRTLAILLVLALLSAGAGVTSLGAGVGLDEDIYRVAVDEESQYAAVVADAPQFRVVEPGADADLTIEGDRLRHTGEPTGPPAYDAFRQAIIDHNRAGFADEPDETAAYPVVVELEYRDRQTAPATDSTNTAAETDDTGSEPATDEGGGGGDIGSDVGSDTTADASPPETPGAISPPFPFESLVLAFLFVVPMNFVIQAYGSTIMDERINRRGELLLVSPASRYEIVAGKTLPYLLGLIALVVGIAWFVGGGPLSVLGALPIAVVFLAATFVAGMLARSFKELTFVTVAISVSVTTYTFVPAIFTEITPIALISPLTIVVMDLQGETVSLLAYGFSTGPFYLAGLVLALLGIGIYREEDMFTQKSVPAKAIDAVASRVTRRRSVALLPILFIPFVLASQLFVVGLLFAVPASVAVPIVLVVAAGVEEVAKSIAIYAGYARRRFDRAFGGALVLGALAGTGFFVGEKLTQVVQLVGLPQLEVARAAFGPALATDPITVVAILLAPLGLHVLTAAISALGARRDVSSYLVAVAIATIVHAGYNLGVLYVAT